MSWDSEIYLPEIPNSLQMCNWGIYTGYRPNLLSPLTFASQQDDDEDEEDESSPFIRQLLCAIRHKKLLKRSLPMTGEMVPVELWWEVLIRAPTKDVARSSCVSKQWRDIVTNPSFRKLHHDRHAAPPKGDVPYALLVSTDSVDGESVSTVFPAALVSPAVMTGGGHAPICRVSNAYGYHLANVCNGFLYFASWSGGKVVVCNPVTGEKLALPRAPPLEPDLVFASPFTFALGFSPTTGVYKLFRFADHRIDSYALAAGDGACSGWRQHPLSHPCCVAENTPTVVVGGKICVLTPGPVMVVDVASEEHRTYNPADYGCPWAQVAVSDFELHGRLCLFWAMPVEEDNGDQPWQLLYKIKDDTNDVRIGNRVFRRQASMSAWFDGETHALCYKEGYDLYSRFIGTTTTTTSPAAPSLSQTEVLSWDCKIPLPVTPQSLPSCKWDIYAGYRPSLLSPLTFASQKINDDDDDEDDESTYFVHNLLCALRHQKSLKRQPPIPTDHTNAKRRVCS
uniref:F-box domain-containing protein n=1 Tax=Oryza barthii TaxID=65489 RepID=A0A0D3GB16_9ORYZ